MKRKIGRRVKKTGRAKPTLTVACGALSIGALFLLGGADKLNDSVESLANPQFFAAMLSAELGTPETIEYAQLIAAQSVALTLGVYEEADEMSEPSGNGPLHDYPKAASPATVLKPDDESGDAQIAVTAADLDPMVKTITIDASSADGYDGVYITNTTKYEIDVQSYLEAEPEIYGAKVLIVHSHASEAYYPDDYAPTDVDRTEDTNFNVVRLGDSLTKILEAQGIEVIHLRDIFDFPTYNGSYTRTLAAIEHLLEEHPDINIVIDIHRDAMIASDDTKYRTVTTIDGRRAAQLMFVMGTDQGGLSHPDWRKNFTFATHLQKALVDRFPTLCRPISVSKSRYNQHATNGSLILEVGTSANMMDEAMYSIEIFGEVLSDFLSNFTVVG